jgi:phosphoglycolate phosphatase
MPKLVLFDIDGTLILSGRAGLRAMTRACEELVGRVDALATIPVAGRTDWIILHDALRSIDRHLDEQLFGTLRDRYLQILREEITLPGQGFKGVMPGVRELLDALRSRTDVVLGLLTGNFAAGARIKLEHFGLWDYFRCGAFGDDSADRNELVPVALARAQACGMREISSRDIVVVGDTPHDIACALAVAAVPVGVATGIFTADELRESGAEIVFSDLTDPAEFMQMLEG